MTNVHNPEISTHIFPLGGGLSPLTYGFGYSGLTTGPGGGAIAGPGGGG
ncbi:MAG: hypothetical protein AABY42_09875 [Nitrospirota bacterium]